MLFPGSRKSLHHKVKRYGLRTYMKIDNFHNSHFPSHYSLFRARIGAYWHSLTGCNLDIYTRQGVSFGTNLYQVTSCLLSHVASFSCVTLNPYVLLRLMLSMRVAAGFVCVFEEQCQSLIWLRQQSLCPLRYLEPSVKLANEER